MAKIFSEYPAVGFHFVVSFFGVPGLHEARFMEVSGLKAELETENLTEAGNNRFTHKLPLRTKYNNLVLKRGLPAFNLSPLTTWANAAIYLMEIFPVEIQVTLLNDKSLPLKIWNFSKAYPVAIEYSGLNAKDSGIVIESLELAYQFVTPVIP